MITERGWRGCEKQQRRNLQRTPLEDALHRGRLVGSPTHRQHCSGWAASQDLKDCPKKLCNFLIKKYLIAFVKWPSFFWCRCSSSYQFQTRLYRGLHVSTRHKHQLQHGSHSDGPRCVPQSRSVQSGAVYRWEWLLCSTSKCHSIWNWQASMSGRESGQNWALHFLHWPHSKVRHQEGKWKCESNYEI